jgi:4'-phosphopantetheinyl transferase
MIETVGIRELVTARAGLGEALALAAGRVDLWLLYLGPDEEARAACHAMLSEWEQARAARFVVESPRHQYVLTHGALRMVLGGYLGEVFDGATYVRGEYGKPYLAIGGERTAVEFNVSHSGDYALMGFGQDGELGVDVEQHRKMKDVLEVARTVFSEEEIVFLEGLGKEERRRAFFRIWTCKEAVLKAEGLGLVGKPKTWCLFSEEAASYPMLPRYYVRDWVIEWADFGPGYSLAWALRREEALLSRWVDGPALGGVI